MLREDHGIVGLSGCSLWTFDELDSRVHDVIDCVPGAFSVDPIDGTAFVGVLNGFVRVDPDGTEGRIASATPIALSWHDGGVLGVLSEGSFSDFGRTENLARWTHEVSDAAGVTVAKDVWLVMSGDDTSGEIVAVDLSGQVTGEIAIPFAGAGLLGSRSLFGVVLPAEVHVFAFDVD